MCIRDSCTYILDTNATRFPQFQYCINILVDTPGVTLPVSVQSSFGFLMTRPDTQHRFDACLKHYLFCAGGGMPSSPRVEPITSLLCTRTFRGSSYHYQQNVYLKALGRRECTFPVPWSSYILQCPGRSRYHVSSKIDITNILFSTLPSRWSPTFGFNA